MNLFIQFLNCIYNRAAGQQALNVQIHSLPNEVLLEIFGYLSPEDLLQASKVCKLWRTIANDRFIWGPIYQRLQLSYPKFRNIDASIWNKNVDLKAFNLEVEDDRTHRAVLYKCAVKALDELYASIENDAGVTLLTIPKGLTIDILRNLQEPDVWKMKARKNDPCNRRSETDIPVPKTYRIIITNSIVKESRGISETDRESLLKKIGCELPKSLEYATLVAVMETFESITLKPAHTLTYCSEKRSGRDVVAGGYYKSYFLIEPSNPRGTGSYGIAAVRRSFNI